MSNDKHLSGEEKRARMKAEIKEDLLKRKQFLENSPISMNKISESLDNVLNILQGDDTDVWIDKLNAEAAIKQAKIEMGLETAESKVSESLPNVNKSGDTKTLGDFSLENLDTNSSDASPDTVKKDDSKTLGDFSL